MWKTRNIRRRNKGKKTKKQNGGLFSFIRPSSEPSIDKIIEFAIKNDIELIARIEKKNKMFFKTTKSEPLKVKFIKEKQIKFIQDEENKIDTIDSNIKPDTPYIYEIKGSNVEVILNLTTKIRLSIDETSIADIKDKMKIENEIKLQKPTEIENKIKMETDKKALFLLDFLQKMQLLFGKKEPTTFNTQSGGADNSLVDDIISKYPSLKGFKSIIDDLPEDIRQKYDSEIKTTLEKVKESNMKETDLMDEPKFQEIQADLNSQLLDKIEPPTTEEIKEIEPTITEETKEVEPTITDETKEVEPTVTDETKEVEPTVTDETKEVEPTVTDETKKVESTVTEETKEVEPTVESPTTMEVEPTLESPTIKEVEPTVKSPTTEETKEPTEETSDITTVVTPTPSDEVTLKREDLKESPLLVQPSTGESGKYIFVPKDLVEKVVDYLLNNGCEVTTVNLK